MGYLLGIDDTDSRFGHCTTHLGYLIVCELARIGCTIPTYPRLVRLNPNVPFKTRGNAAVCVEFEARTDDLREAEADVANGANSALIMALKDSCDDLSFFRRTYQRALNGVVSYRSVISAVSRMGVRHRLLGNGMGVVGAAASLGFSPTVDDHTYELIAYRNPENCGRTRAVEPRSVKMMEEETFPRTFNSYDHESGRVLIAPTGPDPVLAGIRGDSPQTALEAFRKVDVGEEPLGYVIYATNQCTDAHLKERLTTPLKTFSAGWLEGVIISTQPLQGGHLKLGLTTDDSSTVSCMVYEPSGDLRRIARHLLPGDPVRVSGGVRRASSKNPLVINVEKIEVLSVSTGPPKANPRCIVCGYRMKSEGRGKGYQCKKCGHRNAGPARQKGRPNAVAARIFPRVYLPSPRAQRHLTKQLIRYGREQTGVGALIEGWVESLSGSRPEPVQTSAPKEATWMESS
jgi:tRNA(Ile2)-agmatinylcytidine synthase